MQQTNRQIYGEVIALGPDRGGLAYSFFKGKREVVTPVAPHHPVPYLWGGFPNQCVHSSNGMRCEQTGSSKSANGFLCTYHQVVCDPLSFDERKTIHSTYVANRDYDGETIDSIRLSEDQIINSLFINNRVIKLGRGLFIEADRTLAPLTASYDGVWEDVDLSPLNDHPPVHREPREKEYAA